MLYVVIIPKSISNLHFKTESLQAQFVFNKHAVNVFHFDMMTAGAGDQTTNTLIGRRPFTPLP